MSPSAWIELTAGFDRAPDDWSPFVDAFTRYGCSGSMQADDPPTLTGCLPDVDGAAESAAALERELRRLGVPRVGVRTIPDEDWSEVWKRFFKPQKVSDRFVIRPTWEPYEADEGEIVIDLDPGRAFGTGEHPTTRLCLRLLEYLPLAGEPVLDLGCGSGVLGIAAAKLGAIVVAADIEPVSVEVARANAGANRVWMKTLVADGFADEALKGPWKLIASNIISAVLIRLAPEASRRLADDGRWVVSGIIEANWADVESAAKLAGLVAEEVLREDGWVGARLARLRDAANTPR